MFILHFIVIGMGGPFLIGCTNKVIIIIVIIIIVIIIIIIIIIIINT